MGAQLHQVPQEDQVCDSSQLKCSVCTGYSLFSQVFEAIPFIPDTSVEKIGGAFVDEERSLKPFVRRAVGQWFLLCSSSHSL